MPQPKYTPKESQSLCVCLFVCWNIYDALGGLEITILSQNVCHNLYIYILEGDLLRSAGGDMMNE